MPVDSCPVVGIGQRVASDYLPDPEELVPEAPPVDCPAPLTESHWLAA